MNNAQFRKLLETPRTEQQKSSPSSSLHNAGSGGPALGSKLRTSIPMTPRTLTTGNNEFARQLAAHRAAQQPSKKFRSSAAPKGSKLAEGYTDRAKSLREENNIIEDERIQRLEALEKLAKDGQIDREEYIRQTKLLGGDVKTTHLVKGLDFALLKRVRQGENVMDGKEIVEIKEDEVREGDVDEKLEKVLGQDVVAVERKKQKKQGELAVAPKPRTRAEILAELRESRRAARELAQPSLGDMFKKIGEKDKQKAAKEETKVKHVVGADGKVKRKVKRSEKERKAKLAMPPPGAVPLGMMPPLPLLGAKQVDDNVDEEDDDIFAGVGDYDPLAGLSDDDSDDSDNNALMKRPRPEITESTPVPAESTGSPAQANYFNEPTGDADREAYCPPTSTSDLLASNPEIAAALAKAAKLNPAQAPEEIEREKRRKAIIEAHDRDSYDIDMGFGGSTNFADEEDEELASGKAGPRKRKRGAKKKGDKNSADVVGKIVAEKYGKGR